jgi:hypothetical protein
LNPPRSARQSLNYRLLGSESEKCPPIGAFCEFDVRLYTPDLNNWGAKSPIVSSPYRNIPVFWRPDPETGCDQHCVVWEAVFYGDEASVPDQQRGRMAVFRYSSPLLVRPRRMPNLSIATKQPALGNSNKARCRLFEQSFAAHIEQNDSRS